MGLALQMYVSDNGSTYPYFRVNLDHSLEAAVGAQNRRCWWAKLTPYYPLKWTDAKYHCPGYTGVIAGEEFASIIRDWGPPYGSYAYNAIGVANPGFGHSHGDLDLGLGFWPIGRSNYQGGAPQLLSIGSWCQARCLPSAIPGS
jgi:hypothetical protein